jgi:hypothetical protein
VEAGHQVNLSGAKQHCTRIIGSSGPEPHGVLTPSC